MPSSTALRDAGVVAAGLMATAAAILGALLLGREVPAFAALPLGLVGAVGAALVVLLACAGHGGAMLAILAALVFVNDGLFRVKDPGDIGLDWQNAMKFALWGAAGAVGVCRLARSWPLLRRGPFPWLLAYVAYALVSSFYSAAPFYSFSTAFGLLAMLLFAAALAATVREKPFLLAYTLALLAFIAAGWVAYYAVPALGRSLVVTYNASVLERMCGLAGQPNALGNVVAVYLSCAFLLWYRGHAGLLAAAPLVAFGVFTLLFADSRTALLAFLAGAAAVVLRHSLWRMGAAVLGGAVLVLAALSVRMQDLAGVTGGLSRSGDPMELFTLTGRTEIWVFVWDKILRSPWIGYGYNSSKFILPQFDGLPGLKVDEAHNMALQNLLAVGVVGTIPLLVAFAGLVAAYARAPDPRRDCFTFLALVWGVTVAGAFGSTPTVLSLAIFCGLAFAQRRAAPGVAAAAPALAAAPGFATAPGFAAAPAFAAASRPALLMQRRR